MLYFPPTNKIVIVDVPEMNFFMVDGAGDPNSSQDFQRCIEALYQMSYTLKFSIKKSSPDKDFKVGALEALWWTGEHGEMELGQKDKWKWTAMILQPDFVDDDLTEKTRKEVMKKKDNPVLNKMRLERFHEGKSAQIMHIGSWSAEEPTIQKMHEFIKEKGGMLRGKHHEIYMSDPRKTPREKWKTVLRQPFE